MAKLLDANVVIRFLVGDDSEKAAAFASLLKSESEIFILTDVAAAEIVWVLESFYKVSKTDIIEKMQALLVLESVEASKELLGEALELFRTYSIDYIDAYLAAYTLRSKASSIVSYNRDLDKVLGVHRQEP